MGSGAFDEVWPLAKTNNDKVHEKKDWTPFAGIGFVSSAPGNEEGLYNVDYLILEFFQRVWSFGSFPF